MTSGSALPRLALDDLLEIEIPLPPLRVQRQYEKLLIAQDARRQQLMAELRDGPALDLEALVSALEEGKELALRQAPQPVHRAFDRLPLPDAGVFTARDRGRPAGYRDTRNRTMQ